MDIEKALDQYRKTKQITEAALLTFHGVSGFDVYNGSIPFSHRGKRYLFGRVERRAEYMRSWTMLFEETGPDDWTLVRDTIPYTLEDPFLSRIQGEFLLVGTHVRLSQGRLDTYYGYFYRGVDPFDLRYFTTGPANMKDIRLVELADGRIGVFSRPRDKKVEAAQGSEAMIGFAIIDSLDGLNAAIIENAPYIEGLFGDRQWGGCNQAYLLADGKIGVIGHLGYYPNGGREFCYLNMSFVLDPFDRSIEDYQIIGERASYPAGPAKLPGLAECAFTSGILPRKDGLADLYSGLNDCREGRIAIPDPFAEHGGVMRF